ncbi:hypothetical protein BH10PLA2_BH10PLA2_21010 [soil metagenome]
MEGRIRVRNCCRILCAYKTKTLILAFRRRDGKSNALNEIIGVGIKTRHLETASRGSLRSLGGIEESTDQIENFLSCGSRASCFDQALGCFQCRHYIAIRRSRSWFDAS